jgi:hypothetical protein
VQAEGKSNLIIICQSGKKMKMETLPNPKGNPTNFVGDLAQILLYLAKSKDGRSRA